MLLLACTWAVTAVCLPPTTAPVTKPSTTPQTVVQPAQAVTREVVVGGQSMGTYNVGPLTPQPVTLTSQGTLSAAQMAFWSNWYEAVIQGSQLQGKDVIIIARATNGQEVQRWTLQGARPTKVNYVVTAAGNAPSTSVSLIYTNVVASL